MSFLNELCNKKKSLKSSETIVTLPDGRRFVETKNSSVKQIANKDFGFAVDTKPDNVPAKVSNHLYIGSQDCCELIVLKNYSIKYVLSIGVEPTFKFDGITYKFVECLDLPETDIKFILTNQCNPFIKFGLENNANVLVHCNAGVSRSSAIVIGFLILEMKLSFEEAFALVKKARNCIKPNSGFETQLSLLTANS